MSASVSAAVVTVLLTDIEGSSRLWEGNRESMARALAQHDALARAAIVSHRGSLVKSTGDGVLAVFADPVDALEATFALLRALADPKATCGLRLRVRCGLHAGSVEHRDNDWFGAPVNRAARIMAAGHGEQVLLSRAVVELVRDRLPPGIALRDLGSVRLRDLANPEQIHQATSGGLEHDFPALRSLEATPNNLPQQTTSFIGRERELREACGLLADTRLLTIVGPGGIGKTRLSLQVTAEVLDAYRDGVWFVELASIVDPALVARTVAQVLCVPESRDLPAIRSVCEHLASRHILLVLDNCEHLVGACAILAESVLRAAQNVCLLASSREALGIAGEQTYALPPLSVPNSGSDAEITARSESVQLFVERARLHQPGFTITEGNANTVAQLCARLDGIPLALELAAARVAVLPVEKIAERLHDRFRLLTGGSRTALPRQQTLRALIDWSYDLLGDAERTLFAKLSVFTGGFTLEAAEHVGGDSATARQEVLDLLTGLVHKSLVATDRSHGRFRMLETLRDYAGARLQDTGAIGTRTRHCDYFLALAERAEPYLEGGPEQPAWLALLDQEHDNLRSALAWSVETSDRAETALRICGSIYRFWAHRGHAREGRHWCEVALGRTMDDKDTPARVKAMHAAGTLAWRLGDIIAARSLLEQALGASRDLNDPHREGRILSNLGGVAIHQADAPAARAYLEQAVALHSALGNRTLEARVLNNLAALAINEGRLSDAQAPLERALTLSRDLGNRMEEATAMSHLGYIAQHAGNFAGARALHEHALAIAREFGVREFEIEEVRRLGEIALARRDLNEASTHFHAALATSDELGNQREIVLCLEAMAALAVQIGAHEQAATFLGAASALRDAIATPRAHGEQQGYEAALAACNEALGHAATAAAIATGHARPAEAAVADAVAWLDQRRSGKS